MQKCVESLRRNFFRSLEIATDKLVPTRYVLSTQKYFETMLAMMAKALKALLSTLVSIFISLMVLEGVSYVYYHYYLGNKKSAKELFETQFVLRPEKDDCWWEDTIDFHPFLSFAYHKDRHCSSSQRNNVGLKGRKMPMFNDPNYYDILILGGSVAELFAQLDDKGTNGFERYLNDRYKSPNGKPFRILNGALSAGTQPQQVISFALFGGFSDAVISIEGYNELVHFRSREPMETPSRPWIELYDREHSGYFKTELRSLTKKLNNAVMNSFLENSYFMFLVCTNSFLYADSLTKTDNNYPIFELSPMSDQEMKNFTYDRYAYYLQQIKAMASSRGEKIMFFLQPVPAISKSLTENEKLVTGNLDYKEEYLSLVQHLLALQKEGLPIESLLDILKDYRDEAYVDSIHFISSGGYGGGAYDVMFEAMARHIEKSWGLKRK